MLTESMNQALAPEAHGKAAAFDRWLAQGGTPFRVSGKFKQGPMKGLTYDQAKQKFESMWASAPEKLREGYAAHARDGATPSEQRIAGVEPTPAKDMSPAAVQKRRMASYGHEMQDGNAVRIGTPAIKPFDSSTLAGKTREEQAAMLMADAVAIPPGPQAQPTLPPGQDETGFRGIRGPQVSPPAPLVTPTSPVGRPGLSPLAQRELANRKAAVDATPTGQRLIPGIAPKGINPLTGLPFGYQPGDTQAPGGPAIDSALAGQSVKRQEVATSLAAINPQPAAPKPLIQGVSPARQPTALEQSGINRPRTVGPDTLEGRAAATMRRQSEILANPSTENPPGLKLVGPKRPLDELVSRAKLRGIGTPVR